MSFDERALELAVTTTMRAERVPGLAVAVMHRGEIVYARGFGVMRLGEPAPVTPETRFAVASVTKTFTASAVMKLVGADSIRLDGAVADYLPRFRPRDPRAARVTVRHLLSHTSGVPDYPDQVRGWNDPAFDDGPIASYEAKLAEMTLLAEPGAQFSYSNLGYDVLGDLVEHITGNSFGAYVARVLLEPLGLSASAIMPGAERGPSDATPHVSRAHERDIAPGEIAYHSAHAPCGWTQRSTVLDLVRWIANAGSLFPPDVFAAMTTPGITTGRKYGARMGLGWFIDERDGARTILHGGYDIGTRAWIAAIPEQEVAFAALANFHDTSLPVIAAVVL